MKVKRFISALLALVMVLAMAAPAFAEGEEGTEPETTPEVVIGETAEPEVESETEDEEPEYRIYVGQSSIFEGSITSTEPSGKAKADQLVIVNVEVQDGYTVASLTAKGRKSGNIIYCDPIIQDVKYSFTMPAESVGVDISFRSTSAQTYQITYVSNPTEGGTCVGPHKAASGETVTVNVTPNEGYVIKEVAYTKEGDNTHYVLDVDNGVAHFTMPNTEVTVTATFEEEAPAPETYTLTIWNVCDENGEPIYGEVLVSVNGVEYSPDGNNLGQLVVENVAEGTPITVNFRLFEGYELEHVFDEVGNDLLNDIVDNVLTFNMPGRNYGFKPSYKAAPAPTTYNVLPHPDMVHGTVEADPSVNVEPNTGVELYIKPDEGWKYVSRTLKVTRVDNGEEIDVPQRLNFTMPESDVYVYAEFEPIEPETYTLTIWNVCDENGEPIYGEVLVSVNGVEYSPDGNNLGQLVVENVAEGTPITVNFRLFEGYELEHVFDEVGNDLLNDIVDNVLTFNMPGRNYGFKPSYKAAPAPEAPFFSGHSVIISGQIGLEFVVTFPSGGGPGAYPGSYMSFAGHNIDAIDNNPKPTVKGAPSYFYTVHLSSIQMAEKVTPTFHYFVGEEEITLTDEAFSIEDYLDWALVNVTTERHLRVARALADYGYYGQKYLSTAQNWTIGTDYAEQTLKYSDSFNHDAVYAELASYEVEPHIDGLRVRPVFSSLTSMEIRFNLAEGEEVYLDGNLVEPRMIGEGDYAVMTGGIKASQLTQSHTIKVGDKTDDVTLMWYARIMLGRDNPVMKDFMCAFYNYGAACGAFNN